MYMLSDEVDLLLVFSSRFCCVGANDGQVQTIGGVRARTWARELGQEMEARMVGYPVYKDVEARRSGFGWDLFVHPQRIGGVQ